MRNGQKTIRYPTVYQHIGRALFVTFYWIASKGENWTNLGNHKAEEEVPHLSFPQFLHKDTCKFSFLQRRSKLVITENKRTEYHGKVLHNSWYPHLKPFGCTQNIGFTALYIVSHSQEDIHAGTSHTRIISNHLSKCHRILFM